MTSVVLNSHTYENIVRAGNDDDIEMSDGGSVELVQNNTVNTVHDLVEIEVKDTHQLFAVTDCEEYNRRVSVITSFISLMEIAPAKAFYLIREASQDTSSPQFRDYMLFKQIFSDMQRIREARNVLAENSRRHTSSSNYQSIIGASAQLDSLQWMFGFFNMYMVPIHPKNMNAEITEDETILYVREKTNAGAGAIVAVVLAQKPTTLEHGADKPNADISRDIQTILKELESNDSPKTRLGIVVKDHLLTVVAIDNYKTHNADNRSKSVRSVTISQQSFDMCDVSDFAELITVLERFLTASLGIDTVISQIARKNELKDEIVVTEFEDMESSPVPKHYPSFNEKDAIFVDRFNTTLSYLNLHQYFAGSYGSVPNNGDANQYCIKKRSYFCQWERRVLQKLKSHPYIIRELEFEDDECPFDNDTTILFENVRPLNKRLFALIPTDGQGNAMSLTQQLLNTRFEILRQFIKQALHSLIYCHNNGIAHNNVLSRGNTFFLDDQYKLKLMGFEHSVVTNDPQLKFRDMRHLAVVFAELMFNVQFDVRGDDDLTDWSAVWAEIQTYLDRFRDIVQRCPHSSPNDKILYQINMRTRAHMYDLLKRMFHTSCANYYHTYMYHSFVGMASSVFKEKSRQKLREKTANMLHGNVSPSSPRRREQSNTVDRNTLYEKWVVRRAAVNKKQQPKSESHGSSSCSIFTVHE